jgi:hypothetical protein
MKKFLLAGAAIVFAGVAATVAFAADHKATKHAPPPTRATVVTPARTAPAHKAPVHKKHHAVKHHPVARAHSK